MENYIVCIYRRDATDPQRTAGMVESVEKRENIAFKSSEELMQILSLQPRES
jgi:hypothetical protein